MCGLLVCLRPAGAPVPERFETAARLQRHRGPDHTKIVQAGNAVFGFNRLSIIDLSEAAHQPVTHGPVTLAMNGEIYNYVELRRELAAEGIEFQSRGDAEVFAAALHHWGAGKTHRKLRGMWAAAAFDARDNRLTVSRDRLGIKPLWMARHGDTLVFSSEIKSILHLFPSLRSVNGAALGRYLVHGMLDRGTESLFRDIEAFPCGHSAAIGDDQAVRPEAFWRLETGGEERDDPERLEAVLRETIDIHLRSDVGVGLALSGGLDSTILAHYARGFEGLTCYSIRHPRAEAENPLIDETVKLWGLKHAYLPCGEVETPETIDLLLRQLDQPFKATQTLYQFGIRRAAAQDGCKVMLTGDGSDEVFAGYTKCVPPYLTGLIRSGRWLGAARGANRLAEFCGERGWKLFARSVKHALRRRLVPAFDMGPGDARYANPALIEPVPLEYLCQLRRREGSLKGYLFDRLAHEPLPYWLRVEDGISMAVSLETRVPYLDHVLVEEALRRREDAFLDGGRNKAMLRNAAEGALPDHVRRQTRKFQRPGAGERLVFGEIREAVRETVDRSARDNNLLADGVNGETFERDREAERNAAFWFRAYLAMRWHEVCVRSPAWQ